MSACCSNSLQMIGVLETQCYVKLHTCYPFLSIPKPRFWLVYLLKPTSAIQLLRSRFHHNTALEVVTKLGVKMVWNSTTQPPEVSKIQGCFDLWAKMQHHTVLASRATIMPMSTMLVTFVNMNPHGLMCVVGNCSIGASSCIRHKGIQLRL